ncbi:MAG: carboxypeptidase regulatory-like domain-containing protein, partial [Anaerolineae bacterium]|nr:carboxypeptidase regulatory-like domain-containing protein [Anaerolineae bacterium]
MVTVTNTIVYDTDRGISAHPDSTVNVINCTVDDHRIGLLIHGGTLNVANTLVTNNSQYGILRDLGPDTLTIRYSNVWNPIASGGNYSGVTDRTGQLGNISVNPRYKNPDGRNYRLSYVSPAIDAADGGVAPATDIMGAPRYDDPRTPNTGLPTSGGAYADMGAYEFVETAASNIDLVVSEVQGPLAVTAGNMVTITWRVTNRGPAQPAGGVGPLSDPGVAVGPWHDRIYLDNGQVVVPVGEVLVASGVSLARGESAVFSARVRVPGATEGLWRWQVQTNARGEVHEGINNQNNLGAAETASQLTVPALALGSPTSGAFPDVNLPVWYKVIQPPEAEVLVTLNAAATSGRCHLFAGYGFMPDTVQYSQRSIDWNTPDPRMAIPATAVTRTAYLLVMPEALSGGALSYTLTAAPAGFALDSLQPARAGNGGPATFLVLGSGFTANMSARLRPTGGGTERPASQVQLADSTSALVTFDLAGAPLGTYDFIAAQGGVSRTLPGALTVISGTGGLLRTHLILPAAVRQGRPFQALLEYRNEGDADLPAPILTVHGRTERPVWMPGHDPATCTPLAQFIGVSPLGPSGGVLRPGERYTVRFYSRSTIAGTATYSVSVLPGDSATAVDWDALKGRFRPSRPHPLWDEAWNALKAQVGTTLGHYAAALARARDQAWAYGVDTTTVQDLLNFMIEREIHALLANRAGGTLYLGDTAHPLAGADLYLVETTTGQTYHATSWHNGRFGFMNVAPGRYALLVDGYLPDPAAEITTTDGRFSGLQVIVQGGATLTGRIWNAGNLEPVADAIVYAREMGTGRTRYAVSGADGRYTLTGLREGWFWVGADSEQYQSADVEAVALSAGETRPQDLRLSPGGAVTGRVLRPGGTPISDTVVVALSLIHI